MTKQQPASLTTRAAPGPRGRSGYDWAAISRELREDPGEWHMIFEKDVHSLATTIKQSGIATLRPYLKDGESGPGFQVSTRNNVRPTVGPRTCTLYLRYVPGEEK